MHPSSSIVLTRPISGMLMRALGVALTLALVSALATTAFGQLGSHANSKAWPYQPVRSIDDPATGMHWLLERDTAHSGAPGRLTQVASAADAMAIAGTRAMLAAVAQPVIRAGQRLIVCEDSPVVSARLEAVALGTARRKEHFRARLVLGGKVVDVIAIDSKHGTLALSPDASVTAMPGVAK